jgi:diguanylate cyclase (GGDEF)-like protein
VDAERIWFKSNIGLDIIQTERHLAFCAHTVMDPGQVLVVEDLRKDPRFRENPLVVNPPHLHFYAGAPIVDADGFVLGTIAIVDTRPRRLDRSQRQVMQDLAKLTMTALNNRRHAQLLERLALTDYLTGVANRAEFDRALETEMAHARRTGEAFSVLCLDLDGFKDINDCYGHPAGDRVLCEVATRLKRELRTEDTLSRIGGDEFGLIVRETSPATTLAMTRRILRSMAAPITLAEGEQVYIGISIGMATYHDGIDSEYALLAQADSSLYQAKRRTAASR